MDNISIEKIWQDDSLFELRIKASNDFVSVTQECYIQYIDLRTICLNALEAVSGEKSEQFYAEFGSKSGNYTPAFSITVIQEDKLGHVLIEMDMEIADNTSRAHRCSFYLRSDLGSIEKFFKNLEAIADNSIDNTAIQLHN
ncbi:MAG: hypothetical protein IJV62_01130 [Eggerthellaceae bacterium]|nr:hypothetical protein [Eggerthellaceae bacterium]